MLLTIIDVSILKWWRYYCFFLLFFTGVFFDARKIYHEGDAEMTRGQIVRCENMY